MEVNTKIIEESPIEYRLVTYLKSPFLEASSEPLNT
jgi:hypothetical protein